MAVAVAVSATGVSPGAAPREACCVSVAVSVPVSDTLRAEDPWGDALSVVSVSVSVAISVTNASTVVSQLGSCGVAIAVAGTVSAT